MTVARKDQMYAMLARGVFGNTVPMWFDRLQWAADNYPDGWYDRKQWGVRSLTPGGPCRLQCSASEVLAFATHVVGEGHTVNISPMVDSFATVTAWFNVWDSPTGLVVEGCEYPDTAGGWNWRNTMSDPARTRRWENTAARLVLRRHLNANSYDDLLDLLHRFPGHVVELSALERCYGTCPHRNGIVWEVRGTY